MASNSAAIASTPSTNNAASNQLYVGLTSRMANTDDAYKVVITSHRWNSVVLPLPGGFKFKLGSHWEPFIKTDASLVNQLSTLATGRVYFSQAASALAWQGTTNLDFGMTFELVAESDSESRNC